MNTEKDMSGMSDEEPRKNEERMSEEQRPRDQEPPGPVLSGEERLKNEIVTALKMCYDPEIPVNIYELGLIYDTKIEPTGDVTITMTLTAPNCPAAQTLPADVQRKVEAVEGVKSAKVDVVFDPPWTPEKMHESAKLMLNIM